MPKLSPALAKPIESLHLSGQPRQPKKSSKPSPNMVHSFQWMMVKTWGYLLGVSGVYNQEHDIWICYMLRYVWVCPRNVVFLQIMAISVGKNLSLFCIGIGGYPSNSVAPNIGFYTEDYSIWCPARPAMKILVLHIQFWGSWPRPLVLGDARRQGWCLWPVKPAWVQGLPHEDCKSD